jgi:hypothetical protein
MSAIYPMYIKRDHLPSLLRLPGGADPVRRWTVVNGDPGSGKSSLLRSIAIASNDEACHSSDVNTHLPLAELSPPIQHITAGIGMAQLRQPRRWEPFPNLPEATLRCASLFDRVEDAGVADAMAWITGRLGHADRSSITGQNLRVLLVGAIPRASRVEVHDQQLRLTVAGTTVGVEDLSSVQAGVLALISLVDYWAARDHANGVLEGFVLIDDLDLGLPGKRSGRIGQLLTSHYPGLRFLVSAARDTSAWNTEQVLDLS